ncbi:MAG: hypothetical protein AAGE86_14795 [Pseudomonadota bacterium]
MRLRRELYGLMPTNVELVTYLECSPDEAWERVQTSALLNYIAAPLVRFVPHDGAFPKQWSVGEYSAGMLLFGLLPIGEQTIGIEFPPADGNRRILRDNGRGTMIRRWDHWIEIAPEGAGTRYVDRVTVEAGLLTPAIAAFARLVYAHRQRRWRALASSGFAALEG